MGLGGSQTRLTLTVLYRWIIEFPHQLCQALSWDGVNGARGSIPCQVPRSGCRGFHSGKGLSSTAATELLAIEQGCGGAAAPGGLEPGVLLEPESVPYPLRHRSRPHLLRGRLHGPEDLVGHRVRGLPGQHRHLARGRAILLEDAGTVLNAGVRDQGPGIGEYHRPLAPAVSAGNVLTQKARRSGIGVIRTTPPASAFFLRRNPLDFRVRPLVACPTAPPCSYPSAQYAPIDAAPEERAAGRWICGHSVRRCYGSSSSCQC